MLMVVYIHYETTHKPTFLFATLLRSKIGKRKNWAVFLLSALPVWNRKEPDLELEGLLKRHSTTVKFFQGSMMNAVDLQRVKVDREQNQTKQYTHRDKLLASRLSLSFSHLKFPIPLLSTSFFFRYFLINTFIQLYNWMTDYCFIYLVIIIVFLPVCFPLFFSHSFISFNLSSTFCGGVGSKIAKYPASISIRSSPKSY